MARTSKGRDVWRKRQQLFAERDGFYINHIIIIKPFQRMCFCFPRPHRIAWLGGDLSVVFATNSGQLILACQVFQEAVLYASDLSTSNPSQQSPWREIGHSGTPLVCLAKHEARQILPKARPDKTSPRSTRLSGLRTCLHQWKSLPKDPNPQLTSVAEVCQFFESKLGTCAKRYWLLISSQIVPRCYSFPWHQPPLMQVMQLSDKPSIALKWHTISWRSEPE